MIDKWMIVFIILGASVVGVGLVWANSTMPNVYIEPDEYVTYNITVLDKSWSVYCSTGFIETEYGTMCPISFDVYSKLVLGESYTVFTEMKTPTSTPTIRKFEHMEVVES